MAAQGTDRFHLLVGRFSSLNPIYEDNIDYMADDYEMADIDDEMEEEFHGRVMGESESDDDEYDHLNTKITDTSSAQARRGKDIQGIPWERLRITREKYRQTRLEQQKNYENTPQSGEGSEKECHPTKKGGSYYEFRRNTRALEEAWKGVEDKETNPYGEIMENLPRPEKY